MIDAGYDLNVPLRAVPTLPHPGPAVPVVRWCRSTPPMWWSRRSSRSDDGSGALVVRMYEAWGRRGPVTLQIPWDIHRAVVCDLLEREVAEAATDGSSVTLDISPFEITTLRIEPDPSGRALDTRAPRSPSPQEDRLQ